MSHTITQNVTSQIALIYNQSDILACMIIMLFDLGCLNVRRNSRFTVLQTYKYMRKWLNNLYTHCSKDLLCNVCRYILSVRDADVFCLTGDNDIHRAPVYSRQCRSSVAHVTHGESAR